MRRFLRHPFALIPALLVLGSCGSPPRPPMVDESTKRPVNSAAVVELQVCRGELQNTRIQASESGRLAGSASATLARLAARQQAVSAQQANRIFAVRFDFGSVRVIVPADIAATLVDEASQAPLVVLRGRTDGMVDTPADARIARDRALAMRDYLTAAGVDATHIRTTWQAAGDPAADNATPLGRALNRRVEIEVYRALPVGAG